MLRKIVPGRVYGLRVGVNDGKYPIARSLGHYNHLILIAVLIRCKYC